MLSIVTPTMDRDALQDLCLAFEHAAEGSSAFSTGACIVFDAIGTSWELTFLEFRLMKKRRPSEWNCYT